MTTFVLQFCPMDNFREALLIMISTPIYIIVIGAELLFSYIHEKKYYSTKGIFANVYLSALNFSLDIIVRGVCLFVLNYFYQFKFIEIQNPIVYWSVLLIAQDFMFYWLHRVDHYCRLFWAVHVTHHSSEEFNLTVGFRSSVFQPLYRFIYFIPLSLIGFKGIDIMFIYAATQIYGILIHTKTVGKLGFLEWFMSTPSHHRVHHASNIKYLDKNMGMVFIIWDRLFGTFEEEDKDEQVIYGLTENIKTYHPLKMVFHEWINIGKDLRKPSSLYSKFMYVFGPPGWSHDGSKKTARQLRAQLKQEQNNNIKR
ncbi:MAG TPA: sterol desaturase family protein [Bacteroidia bacterium]|nr:sterol desaturase family protein [Bacteroidia bacterium]HRG52180.1 sterol desaturase family protein [Bacteroidia bacterium]